MLDPRVSQGSIICVLRSMSAIAWLFFERMIVYACLAYVLSRKLSVRTALLLLGGFVDIVAVVFALAVDRQLLWGALAVVACTEAFFTPSVTAPFRSSAPEPSWFSRFLRPSF